MSEQLEAMQFLMDSHSKLMAELDLRDAAIAELLGVLKVYKRAGFGNSTDFDTQALADILARDAIAKYDNTNGPDFTDGCSLEGFVGGCERMGCHPNLTTKEGK